MSKFKIVETCKVIYECVCACECRHVAMYECTDVLRSMNAYVHMNI